MAAIGPPLVGELRLTSGGAYGTTRWQTPGKPHPGVDFVARIGDPILAAAPGVVRRVYSEFLGGKVTAIDHGGGVETRYAHQHTQEVTAGQSVAAGQRIGTVGVSGITPIPHLHFEVWTGGVTIDPMRVLSSAGSSMTPASVGAAGGAAVGGGTRNLPPRVVPMLPNRKCPAGYHPVGEGGFFDTSEGSCEINDDVWDAVNDPGWAASQAAAGVLGNLKVDLSGTLEPALNIGVVVASVVLAYGGLKKILGG